MIKRKYLAISLLLIAAVAIAAGSIYGVHSFNAQAGPTVQKGIAKITVLDTFSSGLQPMEYFYYDFEPVGTFINVTEVYYNIIYSGGNALSPDGQSISQHIIQFDADNSNIYNNYNNARVSAPLISPGNANWHGKASADVNYISAGATFNFTSIRQGVNSVSIDSWQRGGPLELYRFELLIEYYYFP